MIASRFSLSGGFRPNAIKETLSGDTRNFHLGRGAESEGVRPLSGPGAKLGPLGFGGLCLPEAKTVCIHCLDVLTAETIKI